MSGERGFISYLRKKIFLKIFN